MRVLSLFLAISASVACARVDVPYDYSKISGRNCVHERKIAVVAFTDGRTREEGVEGNDRFFTYRGQDYRSTDLTSLEHSAGIALSEIVGRHLAKAGLFRQVILVLDPSQAGDADLLLTATLRRARGYVQEKEEKDRLEGLNVLAEVFIKDVEVRNARTSALLFRADVGWSLFEERSAEPSPDPWTVLSEALFVANSQLEHLLKNADLSGGYLVEERVKLKSKTSSTGSMLDLLTEHAPSGWDVKAGAIEKPTGWLGEAQCTSASLVARQTQKFHRVLGPYQPAVRVWACPAEARLKYDSNEEFPALYLGMAQNGDYYFASKLGESNWPDALSEIGRLYSLTPAPGRYVFEIGPHGPKVVLPKDSRKKI